jgi:hypothetical protein
MAVRALRRWSRVVAALLVLASIAGLPHFGPDDPACAPVEGGRHHETDHGLRAGGQVDDDHCAVCHWTRTLRSPIGASGKWALQVAARSRADAGTTHPRLAPALDNRPARAPPAFEL